MTYFKDNRSVTNICTCVYRYIKHTHKISIAQNQLAKIQIFIYFMRVTNFPVFYGPKLEDYLFQH